MTVFDLIIIGAGPAGLTAGLYAGRAQLETKILEKASCGGQVCLTDTIENFPGVWRMNAFAWTEVLRKQVVELPRVSLAEGTAVERIEPGQEHFKVHVVSVNDGKHEVLEAKAVILATGAQPKRLGIPGETALTGRGVSYCATCDGPLFRAKDVVLVGGGDTALEEALYLAKLARKVTVIHRRDAFRAAAILQERVRASANIALALEAVPVEVLGTSRVEGIRIRGVKDKQESVISCDGVFVFVGFSPDTGFLEGLSLKSEDGYILTDESMATSLEGVFACSDCRKRPFYQIVTACSDGAIAAHAAGKFLERALP